MPSIEAIASDTSSPSTESDVPDIEAIAPSKPKKVKQSKNNAERDRLTALDRKSLVKEYRSTIPVSDRPKGDRSRDADYAPKEYMIDAILKH